MFRAPEDPVQRAILDALKATPLEGRPGSLEALYVAHFGDVDSPAMWNGGVVVLETQRVFGGDSGYYYTGSFELSGQTFRAAATVQRHHSWWRSAWGDQTPRFEIEVTATRRADGAMIEGTMRRHDLPGIQLPLKLIRMTDLP